MRYFSYIWFRLLIVFFALIPFPLLYAISDFLRFLLKTIFGYRVSVIKKNIEFCFPDKDEAFKKDCFDYFYKNFIDIILESIKGFSTSSKNLERRYRLRNPELLTPYYEQGQVVSIYTAHYNNWEWGPLTMGDQLQHHIVGIVKRLSNCYINDFVVRGRSENNVTVIPTFETKEYLEQNIDKDPLKTIIFISDQRPSDKNKSTPINFLGKEIGFDTRSAAYLKKYNLPVFHADVHRIRRGYYEIELVPLSNVDGSASGEDIAQAYVQNLEKLINKSPGSWLWSHKRFKDYISY